MVLASLGEHESFKDIIEERIEPTDNELSSDDDLDTYMLREATTGQHISCTCKMGPSSDPQAVVDELGKVHGTDNIYVADASVIPTIPRANTNLPTLVIAERIVECLR